MSEKKFDPYHVWLGIPPKDQPPNLYRLLGLELYESDSQVIDAAANRHTSYLQMMASSPNRRESQELLNEIAAARRQLLDAGLKQEYDGKLKARMAATATAGPRTAGTSAPLPATDSESSTADEPAAAPDTPRVHRLTSANATGTVAGQDVRKTGEADANKRKQASVAESLKQKKKKDAARRARLQVVFGGLCLLLLGIAAWYVIGGGSNSPSP